MAEPGQPQPNLVMPWVGRVWSMIIAFVGVTLIAWAIHEVGEDRLSRIAKQRLLALRSRVVGAESQAVG